MRFKYLIAAIVTIAAGVVPAFSAMPVGAGPNGSVGNGDTARYQGSLALGGAHGCAVTNAGTVKCWGYDHAGQVGNGISGETPNYHTTAQTVSGLSNVASVYAFADTSCALKTDGTVWCWGDASLGTFGIAPEDYSSYTANCTHNPVDSLLWCHAPVQIAGLTGVTALSIGWNHSCAITIGELKCWGYNRNGQLGTGSSDDGVTLTATPTTASVASSVIPTQVTVSYDSTCIVDTNADLYCWGADNYGGLGNGAGSSSSLTKQLIKTGIAAISRPMGGTSYCAIESADGELWCWGENYSGSTGTGTDSGTWVEEPTSTGLTGVVATNGGYYTMCAILSDASPRCWGLNQNGQVGVGVADDGLSARKTPQEVSVLPSGTSVLAIAGGDYFTCAITGTRSLRCWGDGFYGQLGMSPQAKGGCTYVESSNFFCYEESFEIPGLNGIAGLDEPKTPMPRVTCFGNLTWGSPPKTDTNGNIATQKPMFENGCGVMPIGKELILIWAQDSAGRISIKPHLRMKKYVGIVTYSINISGDLYSCTGKKFGKTAQDTGKTWRTFTPTSRQTCPKIPYSKANQVYTGDEQLTISLSHARRVRATGAAASTRTITVAVGSALVND